tara:strand:- start:22 stop:768 length:747 start_codon:yes stop_codon:yes gene_type:complete
MSHELKVKIIPIYRSFFLQTTIPDRIVNNLNIYLDDLANKKDKQSYASQLVGQIRREKNSGQWLMDHKDKGCKDFANICCSIADQYRQQFLKIVNRPDAHGGNTIIPQINEMWSVHSYEGDYNILHSHGCKTYMGMSIVTWTKVPEAISKLPVSGPLNNATGNRDGFIDFVMEASDTRDYERLIPSGHASFKPEVGKVIAFPSWAPHLVWPFFGKGERRTISMNINMLHPTQLPPGKQERYKNDKKTS